MTDAPSATTRVHFHHSPSPARRGMDASGRIMSPEKLRESRRAAVEKKGLEDKTRQMGDAGWENPVPAKKGQRRP